MRKFCLNTGLLILLLGQFFFPSIVFAIENDLYQESLENIGIEFVNTQILPSNRTIPIVDTENKQVFPNRILTDTKYYFTIDLDISPAPIVIELKEISPKLASSTKIIVEFPDKNTRSQRAVKTFVIDANITGKYSIEIRNLAPIAEEATNYFVKVSWGVAEYPQGNILITPKTEFTEALADSILKHIQNNNGNIYIINNPDYASLFNITFQEIKVKNNILANEILPSTLSLPNNPDLFLEGNIIKIIKRQNISSSALPTLFQPILSNPNLVSRLYFFETKTAKPSNIYILSSDIFDLSAGLRQAVLKTINANLSKTEPPASKQDIVKQILTNATIWILVLFVVAISYLLYGKAFWNLLSIRNLTQAKNLFSRWRISVRAYLERTILPLFSSCFLASVIFTIIGLVILDISTSLYQKKSGLNLFPGITIEDLKNFLFNSPIFFIALIPIMIFLLLLLILLICLKPENIQPLKRFFVSVVTKIQSFIYIRYFFPATLIFVSSLSYLLLLFYYYQSFSFKVLVLSSFAIIFFSIFYYLIFFFKRTDNSQFHLKHNQKIIIVLIVVSFFVTPMDSLFRNLSGVFSSLKVGIDEISSPEENISLELNIGTANDNNQLNQIFISDYLPTNIQIQQQKFKNPSNLSQAISLLSAYFKKSVIARWQAPPRDVSTRISSINDSFRSFEGNPAYFIIRPDSKVIPSNLDISLRFQSSSPIYLSSLNQEKEHLLFYPQIKKFDYRGTYQNITIFKNPQDQKNTPKALRSTNEIQDIKQFISNEIPPQSFVALGLEKEPNERLRDIKQLAIKRIPIDNIPSMIENELELNLIGYDYSFFTVLKNKLDMELKLESLDKNTPSSSLIIELFLLNDQNQIVATKGIEMPFQTRQRASIHFLQDDITPGIYKIKIRNHTPSSIPPYLIRSIKINSEKLVLDGQFKHRAAAPIYINSVLPKIKLIDLDGNAEEIPMFVDKTNFFTLKLPEKTIKIHHNEILTAFSEESWFNPYLYNFTSFGDHAEYLLINEMPQITSQNEWLMVNKELTSANFLDESRKYLIFKIEGLSDNETSLFFLDHLQVRLSNDKNLPSNQLNFLP